MLKLAALFKNRESGLGILVAFKDLAREAIIDRETRAMAMMIKTNLKNPLGIFLTHTTTTILGK